MAKVEPSNAAHFHGALGMDGEAQAPLSVSIIAAEAANEILCELLSAIKAGPEDERAVRALSRMVFTHSWVLRVAELHEYLNWLVRKRRDAVVRRIINDPQHPGRKHQSKALLVHLVRTVIAEEACSAHRAAEIVAARFGRDLGNVSASAIKSDYSRYQHEYDRLRAGQFIGAKWLATKPWTQSR